MTRVPFTYKKLVDWGGEQAVREAEEVVRKGMVLEAEFVPPAVRGAVTVHGRAMPTGFKLLPDGHIESQCPCYTNRERGMICAHILALGLVLVRRATDPERDAKHEEEQRRASRLAAVREEDYLRRVPEGATGATPAEIRVELADDWREGYRLNAVPVTCRLAARGRVLSLDEAPRQMAFSFSKADESLLFVLEDICQGPAKGTILLTRHDLANLLRLHTGRALPCRGGEPIASHPIRLASHLRMDLNPETGELILRIHTEMPFLARPGETPFYVIAGKSGWACGASNAWPLETVLPAPYHGIYERPVAIGRDHLMPFMRRELPVLTQCMPVETDLSLDLFTVEPATPKFRLLIRGSPASLSAILSARYGDLELVANKADPRAHFSIPDPDDLMRYTIRNEPAEREALQRLAETGFRGECGDLLTSIVDNREVLNFMGRHLPRLRRTGWQIEVEGKAGPYLEGLDFVTPVVHVHNEGGRCGGSSSGLGPGGWFDVAFSFEDAKGATLSQADIQLALRRGESFIKRGDRTLLIDADAVESMNNVFADCAAADGDEAGHFRLSGVYGPFVKASLDGLDGVDVEDTPEWRMRVESCNRVQQPPPAEIPPALSGILRGYQRQGVDWLRFLEANGFGGILADEMGLGKTIQALVWLSLDRCDAEAQGDPALVVCPTSIVENWAEEAGRFVPGLKVTVVNGPNRQALWTEAAESDLVVTSYALLRRDLDACLQIEFSAMILDEAQHIKNRSTQNAVAAKKVRARHRLVLTGTPVENSVSDLWSLMDFLMPGYLGSHDKFRDHYERPIVRGGPDGELAQIKLRRKLHPFLMRRLKTEVARDLPPKIEKVSTCSLTPDQTLVYGELLAASRRKIGDLVAKQGFQKCRMEILATLMRLRQACCHLELLKLPNLQAAYPSAKMDLFFELLDEAMDGGHRVLVFSQFVSMLTILRRELDTRSIAYCYLDGATKDRLQIVHRFNTARDIPVFLISLKAGGTGLNLTGADMVIHFDPWWNPAVEDQATDRAYRIGQKRTVYSVKLITRGTVEEKVLALQERKQAVISATIESDGNGEEALPNLSWEDIRELLSL